MLLPAIALILGITIIALLVMPIPLLPTLTMLKESKMKKTISKQVL